MKSSAFLLALPLLTAVFARADNPVISQRYTADPTGLRVGDSLYLWTTHDIDGQARYYMNDITCVSTDDLANWTDHGEIFDAPVDTKWASQAWAPSMVQRDGKFYLYYGDGNRSVGVATSSNPTGPFVDPKGGPVITKDLPNADVTWVFDPTVFVDDDGQAYTVFGGRLLKKDDKGNPPKNARIIKLAPDMKTPVGEAVTIDAPYFFEGAYLHKRAGKYYFSYFYNGPKGLNIDYMMGDNPTSGWVYKGTILEQPKDNYNNSHASIFSFKDRWFIAYHTRAIAGARKLPTAIGQRQRSVCVDELFYNPDGTIKPVVPTATGPAQLKNVDAFARNEAETMASQSYLLPGIETEKCGDEGGGRMVTSINNGDWIMIRGVNFGAGATGFTARAATPTAGGTIEIYLDKLESEPIGKAVVRPSGG